jgi:hypothetical protein
MRALRSSVVNKIVPGGRFGADFVLVGGLFIPFLPDLLR